MGDWSNLPKDLLTDISKRFTNNADYVRFHAPCALWRSALPEKPHHLPCQLPWLMLPYKEDNSTVRGFFSLSDSKVNWMELPEACGKRCCGSSQGWLAFVEEYSPTISLLNPLTRAQIQLPPVTTFPTTLDFWIAHIRKGCLVRGCKGCTDISSPKDLASYYTTKVILSKNPTVDEYIVMAIFGYVNHLAFYKSGDKNWTVIKDDGKYWEDIIYFKGQFYAINEQGRVVVCNITGPSPKMITVKQPENFYYGKKYLVDLFGELLLVIRCRVNFFKYGDGKKRDFYGTLHFFVFKLDHNRQMWCKVESLGDSMLFVGLNCSLALSSKAFPEGKANCIYFTDDYLEGYDFTDGKAGGQDLGIFNLEDNSIEGFPCHMEKSRLGLQPPVFVTPSLY